MIYENDGKLDPDLAAIGCYAECIAIYHPDITDDEMNAAWEKAKQVHYVDDDGTLNNPQGFVNILGYPLNLRLDSNGSSHYPLDTPLDPETMHIIAQWHNDATGFTHFVVHATGNISRAGVTYDPIQGGSRTVREGVPVSLRIFDKV